MTWTDKPPTRAGDYRWRKDDSTRPILVEVLECPETGGFRAYSAEHDGDFVCHPFFHGLWCGPLVPAEELEKAHREGWEAHEQWEYDYPADWNNSRAKRVMEGLES